MLPKHAEYSSPPQDPSSTLILHVPPACEALIIFTFLALEWCLANHSHETKWCWSHQNSKNNQKTNVRKQWHCPGGHEKVLSRSSAVLCARSIALAPKKARISLCPEWRACNRLISIKGLPILCKWAGLKEETESAGRGFCKWTLSDDLKLTPDWGINITVDLSACQRRLGMDSLCRNVCTGESYCTEKSNYPINLCSCYCGQLCLEHKCNIFEATCDLNI